MDKQRTAVVTGASTGIGRATATRLAADGWRVFAGIRSDNDAASLAAESDAITPLPLDVTRTDQVEAAAAAVADAVGDAGLAGLVNNAGVVVLGPVEVLGVEQWRRQFEVNVLGQVAVTRAMLPMLRTARGRVVFVGSISGRVAMPFVGPYAASKFALEAVADALRLEVRDAGVGVSILEPGSIATPIWAKNAAAVESAMADLDERTASHYGPALRIIREMMDKSDGDAMPVERAVAPIVHALTARRPRPRYLIGRGARRLAILDALPTRLRDWLIARFMRRASAEAAHPDD